ncbi:MAG TPA: hypothetical protein VL201_02620 [Patescibacteria group bacterium]|jgi:hypothetical protein|nr:hypothetical protein [Patescibacteria group bacterium]
MYIDRIFIFTFLIGWGLFVIKASEPREEYYVSKTMLLKFDEQSTPLNNILVAASKNDSPWFNIIKQTDGREGFLITGKLFFEKINSLREYYPLGINKDVCHINKIFDKQNEQNEQWEYQQFEFLQNYLIPAMIIDKACYEFLLNSPDQPLVHYLNKASVIPFDKTQLNAEKRENESLRKWIERDNKMIQEKNKQIAQLEAAIKALSAVLFLAFLGTCYVNWATIMSHIH